MKVLSTRRVFDHPWEKIDIERVKTAQGNEFDYLVSTPNDFVIIIVFLDDEHIAMVRQYKHGMQETLLGFPAGFINDGETPEECAEREMREEINATAQTYRVIATLSENPTRCRNKYHIVLATDVTVIEGQAEVIDETEGDIEFVKVHTGELLDNEILSQIKAGPMLSAIPYILKNIRPKG